MKREIKFRAWHKIAKQMLYTDTPRYVFAWVDEGQPVELMQFTGLLDKRGREIYEGDILERFAIVQKGANPRKRSVVEWNLYHWDGINQWMQSEVIGNIFENPELLS